MSTSDIEELQSYINLASSNKSFKFEEIVHLAYSNLPAYYFEPFLDKTKRIKYDLPSEWKSIIVQVIEAERNKSAVKEAKRLELIDIETIPVKEIQPINEESSTVFQPISTGFQSVYSEIKTESNVLTINKNCILTDDKSAIPTDTNLVIITYDTKLKVDCSCQILLPIENNMTQVELNKFQAEIAAASLINLKICILCENFELVKNLVK